MRIFTAMIATETNTFAPAPTGWLSFQEGALYHGDGSKTASDGACGMLALTRALAEADGHEVIESIAAFAQPNGRTLDAVYESLREELLKDLDAAMPVDAVILDLHGAMAAQSYDDCEGDLLGRVRAIVGPNIPIGAELDLHCHMTQAMFNAADILVAYKEYPHIDYLDRARELYRLTVDTALGLIKPTTAWYNCRMVGIWHTTREPMRSFVQYMQSLEGRDGVLSVSFGHGFPWADVADGGAKIWVITDNDPKGALQLARHLGERVWEEREETRAESCGVDEAIDNSLALSGGPAVIADVSDNPGGGAPSDSTFILRRLVDRGVSNVAIGYFWDLGAIYICRDAGVGATLDLRIGGKCGPTSGDPVDLRVTVKAIIENHKQFGFGLNWPLGPSVWVQGPNNLDIVLVSMRSQPFDPSGFSDLGIDLASKRLIVVKSTQHFHAGFAPLAVGVVYAAAPGAMSPSFGQLPYAVRPGNYWPRMANPFEA